MRDLDELVDAMREQADLLPATELLPAVRAGARLLRRRHQVTAVVGVVALVSAVGGGFAASASYTPRVSPQQPLVTAVAPVTPKADPAELIGPTWYLVSWTTVTGARVLPGTDRPPTLVFDSRTAAHTDDPANTTTWTIRLGSGTLTAVEGPITGLPEDAATQAAGAEVDAVLGGSPSWQLTGSQLQIRSPAGATLTYTRDASVAQALGGVDVRVLARAFQRYPISGTVVLTAAGVTQLRRQVGDDGLRLLRLQAGVYRVSAVVAEGSCTATTVTVVGGTTAQLDVACLPATSAVTGRQAGLAVFLNARHSAGVKSAGQSLVPGQVTIVTARGDLAWYGRVSPPDGGGSVLFPGRYTVSAKIRDGVCTSRTTVVVAGQIGQVALSCHDGVSTD